MLKAVLLLALALPPLVAALFLPSYLPAIREELDWRAHKDPYAFLAAWPQGRYQWMALAELDAVQRQEGFIARLVTSRYGPRYLRGTEIWKAALNAEGTQVLTGSASTATRWDVATGTPAATYGAVRRRDAEDANKWGYGFNEVAWTDAGRGVVAMTSGPHSLWFHGGAPRSPILLEGDGYEALTALERRVGLIKNLEYGLVIDTVDGRQTQLPHDEVNTIALLPDGGALTASRVSVQWWDAGTVRRSVPIRASYNPLGFSADGRWALVLAQRAVELWSSHTGERMELMHGHEATAVCATPERIVTGTEDGQVYLWSATDGKPLRHFRASTVRIDGLACAAGRLLTLSYNRTDARLWDVAGHPQKGPVLDAAPPNQHPMVRWAADVDLPGRAPAFTRWVETQEINGLLPHAGAGVVLVAGAAWLLARAPRRKKTRGT